MSVILDQEQFEEQTDAVYDALLDVIDMRPGGPVQIALTEALARVILQAPAHNQEDLLQASIAGLQQIFYLGDFLDAFEEATATETIQ
jgi:hypothetical protein